MDSKSKLLKLIEELALTISKEEAEEKLNKLDEEEIELLVELFEGVKEYKSSGKIKKTDPDEDIEEDYIDRLEELQKKLDLELDKYEDETKSEISSILEAVDEALADSS